MKISTSIPNSLPPTALTIGFFDGVHLGHQALLKSLRKRSDHITVFTFIHHPLQILKPPAPKPICSFHQKLALLKDAQVDIVIAIPFTQEFASTPFDAFLSQFPLTLLLLGEGSAFGKNREGNEENVKAFAAKQGFIAQYLPKLILGNEPISSRRIRASIAAGDFARASQLLGRPYSPNLEGSHV
ncbi:MAG TPA: FAD synthetase family protein [Chlamydiales bacterium]|nr:FAD synthetase family protein [Chlamydiales bacterium]